VQNLCPYGKYNSGNLGPLYLFDLVLLLRLFLASCLAYCDGSTSNWTELYWLRLITGMGFENER
jgi:hypothetical protein